MEIMIQDSNDLCVEEDFNLEDDYCKKCANVEACLTAPDKETYVIGFYAMGKINLYKYTSIFNIHYSKVQYHYITKS